MPTVTFTSALKKFFPNLSEMKIEGSTVHEVVDQIGKQVPGLTGYLLEEDGSLRKHVNIFIDENPLQDKGSLSDQVKPDHQIFIHQALSGG